MHAIFGNKRRFLAFLTAWAALSIGASVACAGVVTYNVTMDTSNLTSAQGQYYVDFELNDGAGKASSQGNNTATISNFSLGTGGSLVGSPAISPIAGSITGDLNTGLSIIDNQAFNDFNQAFTPGSQISFTLGLTTNVDAPDETLVPDAFVFQVYSDGSAGGPYSLAASYLQIDITGNPPTIVQDTAGVLSDGTITAAPQIPTAGAVPEPSSIVMLGAGLFGLAVRARRRKNAAA